VLGVFSIRFLRKLITAAIECLTPASLWRRDSADINLLHTPNAVGLYYPLPRRLAQGQRRHHITTLLLDCLSVSFRSEAKKPRILRPQTTASPRFLAIHHPVNPMGTREAIAPTIPIMI
jgi:hypothetical protein